MDHINIKQIIIEEWKGREGDTMRDVLGLGDDNNIYKWHKSTGKWVLNVINR